VLAGVARAEPSGQSGSARGLLAVAERVKERQSSGVRQAVEEVSFTGRVVYIGYAKEPVAYETRLFVQKELDILGSRNALAEDFREVIRMLEAGDFPVEETVSAIVPLEEAPRLLGEWSDNPARFTKIMVQLC